jgi:flagellar basal body-associated protein FliL
MEMKMNSRDKMILMIIGIIVVLVAGFFALIKPTWNSLVADQETYQSTKTEWDGIDQKLQAIPTLQTNIKKTSDEAKSTGEMFINTAYTTANKDFTTDKNSLELDQYMQDMIDASSLQIQDLTVASTNAKSVTYYYYTPNVLTYSLLEAADVNGNYAETVSKTLQESTLLAARETVDMMCTEVTINAVATKESLMAFLEAIKNDSNAILVTDVEISNYAFTDGTTTETTDAAGNVVTVTDPNAVGTSNVSLTIGFYNAKEIDEPDLN